MYIILYICSFPDEIPIGTPKTLNTKRDPDWDCFRSGIFYSRRSPDRDLKIPFQTRARSGPRVDSLQVMMLIFHFHFLGHFWREKECGGKRVCAPNGLGSPNPVKQLAHWVDLLGQPLSRNHVFEIFKGEPPF